MTKLIGLCSQSAWSAQHVVSRRRTMANSYEHYASINELMEAPEGHWIHNVRSLDQLF